MLINQILINFKKYQVVDADKLKTAPVDLKKINDAVDKKMFQNCI